MKNAANFLAEELGDPTKADDFKTAERFHRNFYHGEMEAAMMNSNRPQSAPVGRNAAGAA